MSFMFAQLLAEAHEQRIAELDESDDAVNRRRVLLAALEAAA